MTGRSRDGVRALGAVGGVSALCETGSCRTLLAAVVVGCTLGASMPASADQALADEGAAALTAAVEEVDGILADPSASPADKRARVEYRLNRWLDLAFITRAALGKHAEKFSREQYTDFSQEFGRYVVAVYVQRIAREQDEDFDVQSASWDEKTKTVVVRTTGGKPIATKTPQFYRRGPRTAHVDYRLRKKRGDWRILSISIDGVDVVRMFRDEFDGLLQSKDPDEAIATVRGHNARLEATNPFDR